VAELKTMPVAIQQDAANEQHYELPASFFKLVLGRQLKYSCALFAENCESLDQAESDMLSLTCERAQLSDGQSILELGCGWGSLSLFMAERYPNARILSISNSKSQKLYIDSVIRARGLTNLTIRTADMVDFVPEQEQGQEQENNCPRRFDRVVSVEMFEHLKNYEIVLARVSNWLQENGKLFIHIFTHRDYAYHYENKDGDDWLTEHFFTGGMMPSDNLLLYFQEQLKIVNHWRVSGTHYQKTAEGWLSNMDRNREQIMPILVETYGDEHALKWWVYWRVFFMSCAELWGYRNGQEWIVSHYLFSRR
jgi:cyclopropane-fatty-acyl-phospholipid synthase